MIVSAPLQDLDFGQWLTTLKDNGVSEHCAMELYKDMRMFGSVVFRAEPLDEDSIVWDQFRTQVCDVLKNITTAEQAQTYLQKPARSLLQKNHKDEDEEKKLIAFAKQLSPNLHARQAMGGTNKIVHWLVFGRLTPGPIELTWNDVHAAMSHDIPKVETENTAKTSSGLIKRIAQVMDDTGLKSFQWPSIVGMSTKTGGKIVEAVATTNRELQQRTQWEGGVLGLNKTVHLQIGEDISGSGGYCFNIDQRNTFVCSSPATPTNVLAHEWFHALDYKLSNTSEMLSVDEQPDNPHKKTMAALVDGISSYTPSFKSKTTQKQFELGLRRNLEQRWRNAGYPNGIGSILSEFLTDAPKTLSKKKYKQHFEKISAFLAEHNFPRTVSLHATIIMSDIDVLRNSGKLLSEGKSLWIAFAQRFEDNINTHLPEMKSNADYFFEKYEQLAHSFEVTGSKNMVAFIDPQQNMRYPTSREQTSQKIHWKRFFSQMKNWWDQERGVSVVNSHTTSVDPVDLTSRIAKKRAGAAGSSHDNDLPIAAKP